MCQYFYIFERTVPAYNLFAILAIVVSAAAAAPAVRKKGLSRHKTFFLLGIICLSFLIGARLWNFAVNPYNFIGELKWYSLRLAGLSLYGGLLGAGFSLIALSCLWNMSAWRLLDAITIPWGLAFCIARIGCFLNGCCAGKVTRSIFGVEFPGIPSAQNIGGYLPFFSQVKTVHPTQLYELAGAAIGILILIWVFRKIRFRDGTFFLLYAAWFSAVRLAVLPLRALPYSNFIMLRAYPVLYLAFILVGVSAAVYLNISRKNKS